MVIYPFNEYLSADKQDAYPVNIGDNLIKEYERVTEETFTYRKAEECIKRFCTDVRPMAVHMTDRQFAERYFAMEQGNRYLLTAKAIKVCSGIDKPLIDFRDEYNPACAI